MVNKWPISSVSFIVYITHLMTHFNTVNTSVAALVFRLQIFFSKVLLRWLDAFGILLRIVIIYCYILVVLKACIFVDLQIRSSAKYFGEAKTVLQIRTFHIVVKLKQKNMHIRNVLQYLNRFLNLYLRFSVSNFLSYWQMNHQVAVLCSLSVASNHKTLEMMLTETDSTLDVFFLFLMLWVTCENRFRRFIWN